MRVEFAVMAVFMPLAVFVLPGTDFAVTVFSMFIMVMMPCLDCFNSAASLDHNQLFVVDRFYGFIKPKLHTQTVID